MRGRVDGDVKKFFFPFLLRVFIGIDGPMWCCPKDLTRLRGAQCCHFTGSARILKKEGKCTAETFTEMESP